MSVDRLDLSRPISLLGPPKQPPRRWGFTTTGAYNRGQRYVAEIVWVTVTKQSLPTVPVKQPGTSLATESGSTYDRFEEAHPTPVPRDLITAEEVMLTIRRGRLAKSRRVL